MVARCSRLLRRDRCEALGCANVCVKAWWFGALVAPAVAVTTLFRIACMVAGKLSNTIRFIAFAVYSAK